MWSNRVAHVIVVWNGVTVATYLLLSTQSRQTWLVDRLSAAARATQTRLHQAGVETQPRTQSFVTTAGGRDVVSFQAPPLVSKTKGLSRLIDLTYLVQELPSGLY